MYHDRRPKKRSGCPGDLTDIPYEVLQHATTTTWIRALMMFAKQNNIQIKDPYPKLTTQRKNDLFLMVYFHQSSYKEKQLYKLNTCRMFMNATLLSDITSSDATTILEKCWDRNKGKIQ